MIDSGMVRKVVDGQVDFTARVKANNIGINAMLHEVILIFNAAGMVSARTFRNPLAKGYSGKGLEADVDVEIDEMQVEEGCLIPHEAIKYVTMNIRGLNENPTLHSLIDLAEKWYAVHNPNLYLANSVDELNEEL